MFQFSPNALRDGWNVSISSASEEIILTDPNSGGCGNTRKFLSPVIQMKITDKNGNPVRNFQLPLNITTFAYPFDFKNHDGVCFGYNNDDNTGWKCSDDFEAHPTRVKDLALANTLTYHLTSFAVMLGSTAIDSDHCGMDWISITSITMVLSAVSAGILLSLLYKKSVAFRALVGGYNRNKKISAIENKVNRIVIDDCH